nr:uncharacterized protein LOC18772093 [Ipomoea batatas]
MSHRRIFSQGNVPFSWEEKPGVSKFNHQKTPSATDVPDKHDEFVDLGKPLLPPPPPSAAPTPGRRSSPSLKGMIRDDPFMVAFVKCTKNQNSKTVHNNNSGDHQRKKISSYSSVGLSSKKGRRLLFFCKNAFADVEVDNLMKYSNLPPLPGHKDSIRLHR